MVANNTMSPIEFSFFKGRENVVAPKEGEQFVWADAAATVRANLADAMGARNLSFLFGSGCSSLKKADAEVGIPTMAPMAKAFLSQIGPDVTSPYISQAERKALSDWLGLDVSDQRFSGNLERLMESLFSAHFVLKNAATDGPKSFAAVLKRVMDKVSKHVLTSCTTGAFASGDTTVLDLYQAFYQKLIFRDRGLPRPWVFTTNYDLFNETAMDRRGIPYCNGFSGVIERRFNPAVFRYSLAEQLDISSRKWTAVDSFVYLCKLHGSVNWIEDSQTLFPVREVQETPTASDANPVLIYPTPAKQSASFASPYADLFREFQIRIVQDQSVLVTLGYSFGDEHVNNIIFQALTIPNFRLIAFLPPDATGVAQQLKNLGDPRVWLIGGTGPEADRRAHYFDVFVESFMPALPSSQIDDAVARVLSEFTPTPGKGLTDDFNGL